MKTTLQPLRFTTQDEPPEHQFEAWRSAMATTIDVTRPRGDDQRTGFPARLDAWDMNGIGLVSMEMPGEGFTRQWNHIRSAPADHWSLLIPVGDGRGLAYTSRPMALGSLARPFEGSGADTRVVSLFIARDVFRGTTQMLDGLVGGIADSGLSSLLADFLIALRNRLAQGEDLDPVALHDTLSAMILACLMPTHRERILLAKGAIHSTLAERIKAYVRRHVANPNLSWQTICRQFGISRSSLHRVLQDAGGVSAFIRRERLRAAHDALVDAGPDMTIRAVAEHFGLGEHSGFSRAFRKEFGYAPSDVRQVADVAVLPKRALAIDGGLDTLFLRLRRQQL